MEFEVLKRLRARFGRVSIERLLCGAGIVNIYQALGDIRGLPAELISPEDIGTAAQRDNPLAAEAMAMFFAVLGSSAGNLALTTGAMGGVFIAGGIAPRYIDLLRRSDFRARFLAKGDFPFFWGCQSTTRPPLNHLGGDNEGWTSSGQLSFIVSKNT